MRKESILALVELDLKEDPEGDYSITITRENKESCFKEIIIRKLL